MDAIDSLQYLMACLTTHPSYLDQALRNPAAFIKPFKKLAEKDKIDFINFFEIHAKRFNSATLLLSKKRWEVAELGLEAINFIFTQEELANLWESYTSNYFLTESIPENPLQDALKFITFIKQNKKLTALLAELLEYQIIKLNLLMDIGNKKISLNNSKIEPADAFNNLYAEINDSIISKVFQNKISGLVRFLNANKKLPDNLSEYMTDEHLVIYINRQKQTVSTILLNEYMSDILKKINNKDNLQDCFNFVSDKYPSSGEIKFKKNIFKLAELDLIKLTIEDIANIAEVSENADN